MENKEINASSNTRAQHLRHHHRRRRRYKRQYSRERQSYNSQELRFMLMWVAIAMFLMLLLIPLLTNFFERT